MMKIPIKIFFAPAILLTCSIYTHAQNAVAVSSNPGPGLHVALNWAPHGTPAVKYNIFRRAAADAAYPTTPVNATPVQISSNCATIKTLLIPGGDSTNWKLVAKALSGTTLFDPCTISTLNTSSEKYKRLLVLAKTNMPIAIAAGLGYRDNTVVNGQTYFYRIVALNNANAVVGTVATDLQVTAGVFVPMPPPATIVTEPGDATVLVRWGDVAGAAGFVVERATTAAGVYRRVNETNFSAEVKNKLNGDTLIPSWNGFQDFKRFRVNGKDSTHVVKGIAIDGPINNTSYYYRVSTLDLFDRAGSPSDVSGPVIPRDSTNPSVPLDLLATPDDNTGHVNIRWSQVVRDINGHWEYPDSSVKYRLYRFTSSDPPDDIPSVFLNETFTKKGHQSRDTLDTDPNLRSAFGNKTWWYRLRAVDASTNISQWSTAVSAIVKDITPPAIVKNLVTEGFEDHIAVKWKTNTEPDMASYEVYRSLCHLGDWVECNPRDTCREWQSYDPTKGKEDGTRPMNERTTAAPTGAKKNVPCPCSGGFVFLGEITQDSARRANEKGNYFFLDRSIPAGSPLCYAYWIKAKDSSDNISGQFPIPSAAEQNEIACERLRDRTPPEAALIAGLFAQAEQIRVEWIGPPTQDTRAYHVYRAEGTNPAIEPANSDFKWVGGMTVELPPTLPVVLTSPYTPPGLAKCDKISVQATEWMSAGSFEDKSIKPKLTYWYKVVGIDYDGNESPLDTAAAISTFSFTRKIPDAPDLNVTAQASPCAVNLSWTPAYNASDHLGFIVYRSNSAAGPFTPVVVSPVQGNTYTDLSVVKGQTYWYTVTLLLKNGRMSRQSTVKNITP